jgi:hypothetical protein
MIIRSKELGVISVDAGDVVCFSMDRCLDIAERLNMGVDSFIRNFSGVECNFGADGGYGVDKVIAVQKDGTTYDVVLIGGDIRNFRRFLTVFEPTFNEFMDSHPRSKEIGHGKDFNKDLFQEIAEEYHQRLLDKPLDLQGVK